MGVRQESDTRATKPSASAVSRALRRGGLNPLGSGTPRTREGIRVSGSWQSARVEIDVDSVRRAGELRDAAVEILSAAGYETEVTESGAVLARTKGAK